MSKTPQSTHLRLVLDQQTEDQPEATDLESFHSSWDETNLVTFPVRPDPGGERVALTLTTQRLTMGGESMHLVNITGLACSEVVARDRLGSLPRRYLIRIQEGRREVNFSFCDTPADKYVTRAGYEALMRHLSRGLLPMILSDVERRVEAGETVEVGSLRLSQRGFTVAGDSLQYSMDMYAGCLRQDDVLLVQVADPEPRVVAKVSLSSMNARVLAEALDAMMPLTPAG